MIGVSVPTLCRLAARHVLGAGIRLWSQNDLPRGSAFLAQMVGVDHLAKRKYSVDVDRKPTFTGERSQDFQVGAIRLHEHEISAETVVCGPLNCLRIGAVECDDPAAGRQDLHQPSNLPSDGSQKDIDVSHPGAHFGGPVVDDLVGAETSDEIVLCPAGGCDDVGAVSLGDLNGEVAPRLRPRPE